MPSDEQCTFRAKPDPVALLATQWAGAGTAEASSAGARFAGSPEVQHSWSKPRLRGSSASSCSIVGAIRRSSVKSKLGRS